MAEPEITVAPNDRYMIIVDGTVMEVQDLLLSYAELAHLAYPDSSAVSQYIFTMTYRHADQQPKDGTLKPGDTVRVKREGTIFNVIRTTRS